MIGFAHRALTNHPKTSTSHSTGGGETYAAPSRAMEPAPSNAPVPEVKVVKPVPKLAKADDEADFPKNHRALARAVLRIGELARATVETHVKPLGVTVTSEVWRVKDGKTVRTNGAADDDCDSLSLKSVTDQFSSMVHPAEYERIKDDPEMVGIVPAIRYVISVTRDGGKSVFRLHVNASLAYGENRSTLARTVAFVPYTAAGQDQLRDETEFLSDKAYEYYGDFDHRLLADFFTRPGDNFSNVDNLVSDNINRYQVADRVRQVCDAGLLRAFVNINAYAGPRMSVRQPGVSTPTNFFAEAQVYNKRDVFVETVRFTCTLWYQPGVFVRLRAPSVEQISEEAEHRLASSLVVKTFATAKDFFDWGRGAFPEGAARKVNTDFVLFVKPEYSMFKPKTWYMTSHLLTTLERVVNTV